MEKLLVGAARAGVTAIISAVKGSSPANAFIAPDELDFTGFNKVCT